MGLIADIVILVAGIVVLIKLFQKGGVVQGIIGIVTCQIWTFIWGWMNAKKENLTGWMLVWTGIIVVGIILNVVGGMAGGTPPAGGDVPTIEPAATEGARIIGHLLGL